MAVNPRVRVQAIGGSPQFNFKWTRAMAENTARWSMFFSPAATVGGSPKLGRTIRRPSKTQAGNGLWPAIWGSTSIIILMRNEAKTHQMNRLPRGPLDLHDKAACTPVPNSVIRPLYCCVQTVTYVPRKQCSTGLHCLYCTLFKSAAKWLHIQYLAGLSAETLYRNGACRSKGQRHLLTFPAVAELEPYGENVTVDSSGCSTV